MTTIIIRKCYNVIKNLVPNVTDVASLTHLSTLEKHKRVGEVPNMCRKLCILAGFGNPLLDITVEIQDDKLLKKYNLNPDDQKEIEIEQMNNLLKDITQYSHVIV